MQISRAITKCREEYEEPTGEFAEPTLRTLFTPLAPSIFDPESAFVQTALTLIVGVHSRAQFFGPGKTEKLSTECA
jgi:hypothetical protein